MKLSVILVTYNHEKYITDALDSIMMQKTKFSFEVIVADDFSIDNTKRIVQGYIDRFPGKIRILSSDKNLGITSNYKRAFEAAIGDYIAVLEGDDYWTSKNKLQKQVDFLEDHSECSLCFNRFTIKNEESGVLSDFPVDGFEGEFVKHKLFSASDLARNNFIGNFSACVYRKSAVDAIDKSLYKIKVYDWMFNIVCAQFGPIGFLSEKMSVYRYHAKGTWSAKKDVDKNDEMFKLIDQYDIFLNGKFEKEFLYYRKTLNEHENKILKNKINELEKKSAETYQILHYMRASYKWKIGCAIVKPIRPLKRFFDVFYIKIHKITRVSLVIFDDIYPQSISAFRIAEYNKYLECFPGAVVYSTATAFPAVGEKRKLREVVLEFEKKYPHLKKRIFPFRLGMGISAKLAYTVFIGNMYTFLKTVEENKIPFVFTLYPGGSFELNEDRSNSMLRTVFASPYFRKVIVTQKITLDYLVENNFCDRSSIEFIYGGVFPSKVFDLNVVKKKYFLKDKCFIDICFVANKYMERGVDKGYDVFIDVAKKISKLRTDVRFHVVGRFTKNDIDISDIAEKIEFHGLLNSREFPDFYSTKDIILSPNIPFVLSPGAFDGFPTGSCMEAGMNGVALFITDELRQNICFKDGEEIVIIPHDAEKIVEMIVYYIENIQRIYDLSSRGRVAVLRELSEDVQLEPRIRIISQYIKDEK